MSEASGEKSFAPSQKRLQDAARKGDVLRSRELATASAVLMGGAWLLFAGPWLLDDITYALRVGLVWDRSEIDDFAPGAMMLGLVKLMLPPLLVLGVAVILASLASQLGFGEGRFVAANIRPKPSRINPLQGFKRMIGPTGWIEMAKGLAKVLLLGTIAYFWFEMHVETVLSLGTGDLRGQLSFAWNALTTLLFALAGGLVVIAFADFPVQWFRRIMRLRMTQQEMRDEHKETEGSPEKKAAIRQRQRKIAMGGVAQAMRDAEFVITNPTHFAVAMVYDTEIAPAPVVLAKGRGEKAKAMRELAAEYEVPVLEYPALARSVYYTTRERQVIREELFAAVANVLAFVLSLKRGERRSQPVVDVPAALRFDAEGRLNPAAAA